MYPYNVIWLEGIRSNMCHSHQLPEAVVHFQIKLGYIRTTTAPDINSQFEIRLIFYQRVRPITIQTSGVVKDFLGYLYY